MTEKNECSACFFFRKVLSMYFLLISKEPKVSTYYWSYTTKHCSFRKGRIFIHTTDFENFEKHLMAYLGDHIPLLARSYLINICIRCRRCRQLNRKSVVLKYRTDILLQMAIQRLCIKECFDLSSTL